MAQDAGQKQVVANVLFQQDKIEIAAQDAGGKIMLKAVNVLVALVLMDAGLKIVSVHLRLDAGVEIIGLILVTAGLLLLQDASVLGDGLLIAIVLVVEHNAVLDVGGK